MTTRTTQETLSAAEAKSRFAEALRRAEGGDVVRKPVAALVGADDLAGVRRLRASSPRDGLAGLIGRWDDGAEFADEVDRVVSERVHSPARTIPDLDGSL